MRRLGIVLLEVVGSIMAALLILAVIAAWRLSGGPVTLDFLSPYISEALNPTDASFAIELEDTILTWAGWDRNLDIRARGVRAIRADGTIIARVPELSIELSMRGLTRGIIAPTSLDLIGPSLRVVRAADGSIELGLGEAGDQSTDFMSAWIADLSKTPDPKKSMGYLTRVSVLNAALIVDDRVTSQAWHAALHRLELARDIIGIRGAAALDLDVRDTQVALGLVALYDASREVIDLSVSFNGLDPALIVDLAPEFDTLRALDLSIDGKVQVRFDTAGHIEATVFDLTGRNGQLVLPRYFPGGLPVALVQARGRSANGLNRVFIDSLLVDLGGPTAIITAEIDSQGPKSSFRADVALKDMPGNDVSLYWPPGLAKNSREWVVNNLRDGLYGEVSASLAGTAATRDLSNLTLESLTGTIAYSGMRVDYIEGMPPARQVTGTATFGLDSLDLVIESGVEGRLRITEGAIAFIDLDKPLSYADIDLLIQGPLHDAVALIDHEPLFYARKLEIDPSDLSGESATRLHLRVPLIDEVKLEAVGVGAGARLTDMRMREALFGLDATEGELTLRVDKTGLRLEGSAKLATMPVDLVWDSNFTAEKPIKWRLELTGVIEDATRATIGLDVSPVVTGPVGVHAVMTERRNGRAGIVAELDLSPATMALSTLNWSKAPSVPGSGRVALTVDQGRLAEITNFSIRGGGLAAEGTGRFGNDGQIERVEFSRLAYGLNDVKNTIVTRGDDGYRLELRGPSFDGAPFLTDDRQAAPADQQAAVDSDAAADAGIRAVQDVDDELDLPPLSVSVDLDRVWIGSGRHIDNVKGELVRNASDWEFISIDAEVGAEKGLRVRYEPGEEGYALSIYGDDAGEILRVFDIAENVVGGTLQVTATEADPAPESPLTGEVLIENCRVVKAPLLAQILTLASLIGIVDSLSGEGIKFDRIVAPFTMSNGVIEIEKAKSRGSDLGLTLEGTIDRSQNTADFKGLIVPAYTINSILDILGQIPIVREIFVGEEGGGVFAATYKVTGSLDEPNISVNPLAVLTPGFLRNIFDIFDRPADADSIDGEDGEDELATPTK